MTCHVKVGVGVQHFRKHRVFQEAENVGRNVGKSLYCGFCGKNDGGRGSRLRTAGENTFHRLWGTGAVSSCLLLGHGVIRVDG